ncbi:MAG: amidohydrolase family protein [Phycisphaeraceae bacterium]|nr:amidohydrolase family protein [Phycisphaeraceae bacterium]
MTPPLRDAHVHIASYGRWLSFTDLSTCQSHDDCLNRLSAARPDASGWIIAVGARPRAWREGNWPSRVRLDEATGRVPAIVWGFDLHSVVANSTALDRAGIHDDTPEPPGGVIEREGGRASGVLLEAAARVAWSAVPEPMPEDQVRHVSTAIGEFGRLGFTEVHDMLSEPWLGPALAALDDSGDLPIGTHLYVPAERLAETYATSRAWQRERVRLVGSKLFADGTLNSRTAWMLDDYADPLPGHPQGTPLLTPASIDASMREADRLGLHLAVHAIGDAAVRFVLDSVERVRPRYARIEHAEIIDESDVPRFARLGVACSPQPSHLLVDGATLHRSLPHRLDRVLPLRELIDAGCAPGELLVFGSDAPIVRANPADGILAATARAPHGLMDRIAPHQAITASQAWAAFRPAR